MGDEDGVRTLKKLHFLIHGFCYAEMACGRVPGTLGDPAACYLERENKCAERWRSELNGFASTEGLVIIPWPGNSLGPLLAYHALAVSTLGDRCFILDCPDCLASQFWSEQDKDFRHAILAELQAAFVQQNLKCNKEELVTDLHCLACSRRLEILFRERGYSLDRTSVVADSWGASFDGCVTKYTLTLRRMLGLSNIIEINYGLTVPDASFLVNIMEGECILVAGGLRLFIFRDGGQLIALFTLTAHSLADRPVHVKLPIAAARYTVRSKQGIRLWPNPETYMLPAAPLEYREPAQQLVRSERGVLYVPVSAGFGYRLAKAPAYLFAPTQMPYTEFRDVLLSAELACP